VCLEPATGRAPRVGRGSGSTGWGARGPPNRKRAAPPEARRVARWRQSDNRSSGSGDDEPFGHELPHGGYARTPPSPE
jgi:hypothetical protein